MILTTSALMLAGNTAFAAEQIDKATSGSLLQLPDPGSVPGPRLGEPLSAQTEALLSINVFADGWGLPEGSGSVVQGATLYQAKCLSCHGSNGQGGSAEPLAGAEMGLTDEWPQKTIGTLWPYATTLFDFIRRSMPMTAPGSLSDNETYALSAYLLFLNDIVAEDVELDRISLPQIKMPNADGFINVYEDDRQK